jgi:hypothetical protein
MQLQAGAANVHISQASRLRIRPGGHLVRRQGSSKCRSIVERNSDRAAAALTDHSRHSDEA